MIKIKINELAQIVDGELFIQNEHDLIQGVSTDSRTIQPNQLYIPLIGAKFDGHDFINQVNAQNVSTTLWSRDDIPPSINVIKVDNTLVAMQKIAKFYIEKINPKVIAVTGSNGKTSIKDILKNLLSLKYKVHATKGNFNNDIGLPLTIFDFEEDVEVAILEMGMEGFNEINVLSKIASPDIAIISNIGTAHIKELGSRENIALAKLEILEGMKEDGLLIVDKNEPLLENKHHNIKYFDVNQISNFKQFPTGISFEKEGILVESNLLGKHQVENILAAWIAAAELGLEDQFIVSGLKKLEMTKMRNDFYQFKDVYILDDSYKSNPESATAALQTLNEFDLRKVAVLADMLDLGENEINYHEALGSVINQMDIDQVYLYGPLSKYTAKTCQKPVHYYEDKFELAKALSNEKDCIILFKASRGLKMEEVINRFKELKAWKKLQ